MSLLSDPAPWDRYSVRELVRKALEEDGASLDLTTDATVHPDQLGRGIIIAKQAGVICGINYVQETYFITEPRVQWLPAVMDGTRVLPGATLGHLAGPLHAILRAERVALNFLGRLSGVATLTAEAVDAVAHTRARILDTRKTTPGLRTAERYAVRVGGGLNHRFNLSAGILIKDNHIAATRARGGSLADAVRAALALAGPATAVEVEVRTLGEAREALAAGARALLLDNFALDALPEAVTVAQAAGAIVEASGGMTLDNVAAVAETGVDFISLGAITHSAPAFDASLDVLPQPLDQEVRPRR